MQKSFLMQVVKGVIFGVAFILAGVLLFAFIVELTSLSDKVIKPINQFIKLMAIFGGCAVAIRGEKGFLKGGIIGLAVTIISYVLFGVIGGTFGSFAVLLIDALCGIVMGVISGVISVNIPRKA